MKMHKKSVGKISKDKEVGRWKVIEYALTERGLPVQSRWAPSREVLKE